MTTVNTDTGIFLHASIHERLWDYCWWKVMEAHMLKFQDELSQQEHSSQKSGNPECNDQPLQ